MTASEFNVWANKELSKYIKSSRIVAMIIESSNNTYELFRLWQMRDQNWYSNAILAFCDYFSDAIANDHDQISNMVAEEYPKVHLSLQNYHDSFFLQNQNNVSAGRHRARAYFRMMGDTLESVHLVHVQFIYKVLTIAPLSPLYGRRSLVSNGKAVSELLEISAFEYPLKGAVKGVPLSQWRNICHHSAFQYDDKQGVINCNYGNNQTVRLTMLELEHVMVKLDIIQALLKSAIEFAILGHLEALEFGSELDITQESILSSFGNLLAMQGFSLFSIKQMNNILFIEVTDIKSRHLSNLKQDLTQFAPTLLLLRHIGIEAEIHLTSTSGQPVGKLLLPR